METEPSAVFFPVNRISQFKTQIPVTVKVGSEYIQVMTVRKQELFYNISAVTNDVFLISDIEDITIGSHGRDTEHSTELSFKFNRGKSQITFSTPKRDTMISVSHCYYFIMQLY